MWTCSVIWDEELGIPCYLGKCWTLLLVVVSDMLLSFRDTKRVVKTSTEQYMSH